jgi:CRP-like cAMP-binding protein
VAGNEGEVIEVNWRSVHLQTRERDLLVVPNSILAKETIVNTRQPTRLHAERIPIAFSLDAPPNRVREILTQVGISLPNVLSEPPPKVEVMEFAEDRIRYEAKLYTTHLREIPKMRSEFATRVWYAAQRAGLALPVPIRNVQAGEPYASSGSERVIDTLRSLVGFASLDEPARKTLTEGARLLHYAAGETALGQGESCGALCVVSDGLARMTLRTKAGDEREVMELHRGETFGEGALLKGEPSPVTVTALRDLTVVALDTAALESVLESAPGLASELGQLVEIRRRSVQRVKYGAHGEPEVQSASRAQPGRRDGTGRVDSNGRS